MNWSIKQTNWDVFLKIGIIESDDIKRIQQEIDKAVEFSKKAASLVDLIRRKDNNYESYSDSEESEREIVKVERKPIGPPKQTSLSLQRMVSQIENSFKYRIYPGVYTLVF